MTFGLIFLKYLANCSYFEIINHHVPVLKLDFMIIEFYVSISLELNFSKIKFQLAF